MIIKKLFSESIDNIIDLQNKSIQEGDDFIPSSRDVYIRAFMFQNFVYGVYSKNNELLAFCNCSIPTSKAKINLGRIINNDCLNTVGRINLNSVGHINTIIVAKDYRKKGIGKELIKSVLDIFQQKCIQYIFVIVSPNNQASLSLFKKMGFYMVKNIKHNELNRTLLLLNIKNII